MNAPNQNNTRSNLSPKSKIKKPVINDVHFQNLLWSNCCKDVIVMAL